MRYILLKYGKDIENINFDYPVVEANKNEVTIKVDTSKYSISEVLEKFMRYGNVIDLEAMPVPLEEVIYDIYTRGDTSEKVYRNMEI